MSTRTRPARWPAACWPPLLAASGLQPAGQPRRGRRRRPRPPRKTYVAPGEKDEYYLFYSGGHSGQVYVAGLPSMRHIVDDPGLRAATRPPATASTRSRKQMLGRVHLGRRPPSRRCRRPTATTTAAGCSSTTTPTTASRASTCATSRPSRSSARFRTRAATTARRSSPRTANTCWSRRASRCRCPKGRYADPATYETEFNGMVSGIKIDPKTGDDVGRLADPDAAVQLGSRHRPARGRARAGRSGPPTTPRWRTTTLEANSTQRRSRLRRDRQLARGRAGGEGRQGDDDRTACR